MVEWTKSKSGQILEEDHYLVYLAGSDEIELACPGINCWWVGGEKISSRYVTHFARINKPREGGHSDEDHGKHHGKA